MNAGYFYCPYIPLLVSEPILERDDEADALAIAAVMHQAVAEDEELDLWHDPESVFYIGPKPLDFNWLQEGF